MSAKSTIFIQVCQELWDFAEDGERYYEKIVHSFLPSLVSRWNVLSTNHVVTVVLISRVYYDQSEVEYAAGPLRTDDTGNSYKDFFKVVVDHDLVKDWSETLVVLKQSFWDFQRDILFTHHYHRPSEAKEEEPSPRLVGRLSFAHNGPILEALNLGLNPTETHYIDRSLALTGSSTIVITPGTGHFNVSKDLLRLTTSRILDQGFGLDLVSLSKSPLHRTPVFKFKSLVTPSPLRPDRDMWGNKDVDPLWLPDAKEGISKEFWWEPFWVCVSFWDYQWDLPIRVDR